MNQKNLKELKIFSSSKKFKTKTAALMLTSILSVTQSPVVKADTLIPVNINVSTGVNVFCDDISFKPTDANGNEAEVFLYNGTTYLPIRSVAKLFDADISWNDITKTVNISSVINKRPVVDEERPLTNLEEKQITVYAGVKMFVDGKQYIPRDQNNNIIDILIYNGTTYLPLRAAADIFYMLIVWEPTNNSVYLGNHKRTFYPQNIWQEKAMPYALEINEAWIYLEKLQELPSIYHKYVCSIYEYYVRVKDELLKMSSTEEIQQDLDELYTNLKKFNTTGSYEELLDLKTTFISYTAKKGVQTVNDIFYEIDTQVEYLIVTNNLSFVKGNDYTFNKMKEKYNEEYFREIMNAIDIVALKYNLTDLYNQYSISITDYVNERICLKKSDLAIDEKKLMIKQTIS